MKVTICQQSQLNQTSKSNLIARINHVYLHLRNLHLRNLAFGAAFFLLAGCVNSGPFANIQNPFAPTADVGEVYVSQFPDVPIPKDMHSIAKDTLVTPAYDGTRFGLETFAGRVESQSLATAMIHNLARQGWALRGSASGKRIMQLHEKDNRYIIIHITEGPVNTEMEVWLLQRLQQSGYGQPISTGQSYRPVSGTIGGTIGGTSGGASVIDEWEGGKSYQLNN